MKLQRSENWGDPTWNVLIRGVKVGWVLRERDGTWAMYGHTRPGIRADRLTYGARTRNEALRDGIGNIRIWHGGGVYIFNFDTIKDELIVFTSDTLQAIENHLLDRMYPMTKEA